MFLFNILCTKIKAINYLVTMIPELFSFPPKSSNSSFFSSHEAKIWLSILFSLYERIQFQWRDDATASPNFHVGVLLKNYWNSFLWRKFVTGI